MASDPIYRVALPSPIVDVLDASGGREKSPNLTPLVVEFSGFLNPLAAARTTAEKSLDGAEWRLRGHCAASVSVIRLMRDMAQDARLLRVIGARYPKAVEGDAIKQTAMPMLFGLAVVTAVRVQVGVEGSALASRMPDGVPRSERKHGDAGTPSGTYEFKAPALGGPRPELAPIPHDLDADA